MEVDVISMDFEAASMDSRTLLRLQDFTLSGVSVEVFVPVNGEVAISNSRHVVVLQVDDSLRVLHNRTAINSVEYTVLYVQKNSVPDPHPDP
jgi:hypothetical protein